MSTPASNNLETVTFGAWTKKKKRKHDKDDERRSRKHSKKHKSKSEEAEVEEEPKKAEEKKLEKCFGVTKCGSRCKRKPKDGEEFCYVHLPEDKKKIPSSYFR